MYRENKIKENKQKSKKKEKKTKKKKSKMNRIVPTHGHPISCLLFNKICLLISTISIVLL